MVFFFFLFSHTSHLTLALLPRSTTGVLLALPEQKNAVNWNFCLLASRTERLFLCFAPQMALLWFFIPPPYTATGNQTHVGSVASPWGTLIQDALLAELPQARPINKDLESQMLIARTKHHRCAETQRGKKVKNKKKRKSDCFSDAEKFRSTIKGVGFGPKPDHNHPKHRPRKWKNFFPVLKKIIGSSLFRRFGSRSLRPSSLTSTMAKVRDWNLDLLFGN